VQTKSLRIHDLQANIIRRYEPDKGDVIVIRIQAVTFTLTFAADGEDITGRLTYTDTEGPKSVMLVDPSANTLVGIVNQALTHIYHCPIFAIDAERFERIKGSLLISERPRRKNLYNEDAYEVKIVQPRRGEPTHKHWHAIFQRAVPSSGLIEHARLSRDPEHPDEIIITAPGCSTPIILRGTQTVSTPGLMGDVQEIDLTITPIEAHPGRGRPADPPE